MRNVRAALVFILIVTLFAAACGGAQATAPSSPTSAAVNGSPATIYLNEVVGLMEANSINRSTINWTDFRAQVFADRKSTRLNSSHSQISYAVFCLKKKNTGPNSSHSQLWDALSCLKQNEIPLPQKVTQG